MCDGDSLKVVRLTWRPFLPGSQKWCLPNNLDLLDRTESTNISSIRLSPCFVAVSVLGAKRAPAGRVNLQAGEFMGLELNELIGRFPRSGRGSTRQPSTTDRMRNHSAS